MLPNPVDEDIIRNKAASCKRNIDERSFISVGRLTYQKGFDRLIKLFSKVSEGNLLIIGEGEEREELTRLINEYGLSQRVFLEGLKENPWEWIACADAFLMSSRWEGLPNVVLEALSCGVKVIATPESGAVNEIKGELENSSNLIIAEMPGKYLDEIEKVKKRENYILNKSYLPYCYKKNNVWEKYEELIKGTCE